MTEDLAARVLAAIAETERVARDAETACWHVDYCDDRGKPFHRQHTPELVLRRCAADRKILTKILPEIRQADANIECEWGSNDDCAARLLTALAEAYDLTEETTT